MKPSAGPCSANPMRGVHLACRSRCRRRPKRTPLTAMETPDHARRAERQPRHPLLHGGLRLPERSEQAGSPPARRLHAGHQKYPVVYLLPVNTGTSGQWGSGIVEAKKANLQNAFGLIFVAPAYDTQPWFGDNPRAPTSGRTPICLTWCCRSSTRSFPPWPGHAGRMLIGFSKSGLGAWQLFLMHLDVFDQVAIFDSYQGPAQPGTMEHLGLRRYLRDAREFRQIRPAQTSRSTEADPAKRSATHHPDRRRTRGASRGGLVPHQARRLQDSTHLHPRFVHAAQLVQRMAAAGSDRNGFPGYRHPDRESIVATWASIFEGLPPASA